MYQSEPIVDELVIRIQQEVDKLKVEIILIGDGSVDSSWKKIEENCSKHSEVKGIKLSRNFGQHYAITSGQSSAGAHASPKGMYKSINSR